VRDHALSGTDHVTRAADLGIPYFKHDFAYEFGVARPAKSYGGGGGGHATDDADAVGFPVLHEFTTAPVRDDGGNHRGRTSSAAQMSRGFRRERFTAAAHATG